MSQIENLSVVNQLMWGIGVAFGISIVCIMLYRQFIKRK